LNNHFDDQWKALQQFKPTRNQKDAIRSRIKQSIEGHPLKSVPTRMIQWKSILSACLLFLICGSFLWMLLKDESFTRNANQPEINIGSFTWELDEVYAGKSDTGFAIYRKNKPLQVGTLHEVTEVEMNKILQSSAMFVHEQLDHFPYPTEMYIEHKKMMDVALRYHFFIPLTEEKWAHFTFDYQQLEFAEIFQVMATLEIKGMKPYEHDEQLYVKHGYGSMIYPVGLNPISISAQKEVYHWEKASLKAFNNYLENIHKSKWKGKPSESWRRVTFVSQDGNQEVTIILEGKKLTYEFFYPNQE
jgi:hypothetical protein